MSKIILLQLKIQFHLLEAQRASLLGKDFDNVYHFQMDCANQFLCDLEAEIESQGIEGMG